MHPIRRRSSCKAATATAAGIFRVCYDLLVELGKDDGRPTSNVHGFVYVGRNERGVYDPDPVQIQAVGDCIAFFNNYMK